MPKLTLVVNNQQHTEAAVPPAEPQAFRRREDRETTTSRSEIRNSISSSNKQSRARRTESRCREQKQDVKH